MMVSLKRKRRFTLIEIMIVLVLIGLAMALVGPALMKNLGKGKRRTAKIQIELLSNAALDYYLDMDKYPSRLEDLVRNPGDDKWDGPYLGKDRVPKDPWGSEYQYQFPGQHGTFDIVSYGADQSPGGDKENADITSWEE